MLCRETLFSMPWPAIFVGSSLRSKSFERQELEPNPARPFHPAPSVVCSTFGAQWCLRYGRLIAAIRSPHWQAAIRDRQFSTLTSGGHFGTKDDQLPEAVCTLTQPNLPANAPSMCRALGTLTALRRRPQRRSPWRTTAAVLRTRTWSSLPRPSSRPLARIQAPPACNSPRLPPTDGRPHRNLAAAALVQQSHLTRLPAALHEATLRDIHQHHSIPAGAAHGG